MATRTRANQIIGPIVLTGLMVAAVILVIDVGDDATAVVKESSAAERALRQDLHLPAAEEVQAPSPAGDAMPIEFLQSWSVAPPEGGTHADPVRFAQTAAHSVFMTMEKGPNKQAYATELSAVKSACGEIKAASRTSCRASY